MRPLDSKIWNAIIDISPVQFGVYDLEQHLQVYSSGLAEKVSGYSFDELQKFSRDFYKELILHDDFPSFEGNLNRLLQSDKDITVESIYRVRGKQGNLIWVRSNHRVFERDDQGQPIKIIASSEDITELKELEQKLEVEVDKLQAIPSENLDELRVQLNIVSNIMSLFRENHFSSEMDRRLWSLMYQSVHKMDQVINNLYRQ